MMKGILRNFSIHFVFKVIAIPTVLITGLLVYLITNNQLCYKLKATYYPADKLFKLYHDFDKDGYSEIVKAFHDAQFNSNHVSVERQSGQVINEWSIPGYSSFQARPCEQWLDFGDINNDGYDDIIVFAQENDSLFLYVIDVKNSENNPGKFLINRSFLLKRGPLNRKSPWDVYFNQHAVVDLDNDGQNELIFTLVSGHSLSPRGIYIYDFKQRKIIHQYLTNASLMNMDFFDLNNDGKKEIIVSTYSGGNFPLSAHQSDFFNWLFVFSDTLKPLFAPIRFYGFASSFYTIGVKENTNSYIIGFLTGTGKSNEPPKFLKINPDGTILKSFEISNFTKCNANLLRVENDSLLIYIKDISNNVFVFDQHFKLLYKKQFPYPISFHTLVDLDNDGEKEIIATMPFRLLVLNKKLKLLAQAKTAVGSDSVLISIEQRGNGNNKNIYYAGDKFRALYSFSYLPIHQNNKFLLGVGGWFVLVLFLLLMNYRGFTLALRLNALFVIQRLDQIGILVIDDRGKIVLHNITFLKMLNFEEVLKKGKTFKSLTINHSNLIMWIEKAIKEKEEIVQSISLNGNTANLTILPIRGWAGCVAGYYIELSNKKTRCFDERTKIWTNTIKKLAHDIKTPLSNIEMGVRTVKDSITQSTLVTKNILVEDLDVLSLEVKRITKVVSNFLKFVNLETPHFQLANIHECIQNSTAHFEAYWKNNFDLELEFEPNMPLFYFDPLQLEMVFNNLIKNALDALRENGKIIIRTSLIKDEISQEPENFCEIEITDNGPGMDKEKQRSIFEPNFTDKIEGNGLGLTIVKKIIEDHHGEIKVFSTPGLGTTFRILLPLNKKENIIN